MEIDLQRLRNVKQRTVWDFGNEVLYRLCREFPNHDRDEEIVAKIWLIGRAYSAGIERRRTSDDFSNESFYADVVAPRIRDARIDAWLVPLLINDRPEPENSAQIISAHKRLTDLFKEISGLEQRSLASKYLHFHFPNLFYIYDSRTAKALADLTHKVKELPQLEEHDSVYAGYFFRCLEFVAAIKREHDIYLNPRRLDNYLLALL